MGGEGTANGAECNICYAAEARPEGQSNEKKGEKREGRTVLGGQTSGCADDADPRGGGRRMTRVQFHSKWWKQLDLVESLGGPHKLKEVINNIEKEGKGGEQKQGQNSTHGGGASKEKRVKFLEAKKI